MNGTVTPNIFDRLALAFGRAVKAAPQPGLLYPPRSGAVGAAPLTWPGWEQYEQQYGPVNRQDEQRVRQAVQSPWVFADVQAIANEFSAIELQVKRREGEELVEEPNHPLERLWEAPNPHMGRSYVASYWAQSYTYVGKAFLYWILDPSGAPVELWPVPPFMLTVVPDAKRFIGGYAFRARPEADPILIPADRITFSRSVNLFDLRDGMSFLVAAGLAVETDAGMGRWNKNFFSKENATPEGLITVPRDTLDSDLARVRQEIWDFFSGANRRVAVARAGDMDWKPFGRSQKEMEFTQGRDFASREIGRTLGFPDGYWSETANRANAEQARATMIAGAVWPLAVRLAEDMNAQQVPAWYGADLRVEFKDIRPEDRGLFVSEQTLRMNYWTIDELREADGKDPLGDYRGKLLIEELKKAMPLPGTEAAAEAEDAIAEAEAAVEAEAPAPVEDEALPPVAEEAMPVEEEPAPLPDDTLKAADLERWQRKALKALRAGRGAAVPFAPDALGADEAARIAEALRAAQTPEDVRAAFKAGDEPDIDGVWEEAARWARAALREEG